MNIVERVRAHGGIADIVPTSFVRPSPNGMQVIGAHNVVVCRDGTRFGLSLEDEARLIMERV